MTIVNPDAEIARLGTRVKACKEEAKDYRDEGDVPAAIKVLEEALAMLQASPLFAGLDSTAAPTTAEKALAAHLADCHGMIGGNYRRLNRFDEALKHFKLGRFYERQDRLSVDSSYNLVNAITLPLEMRTRTATEQREALEEAVTAIDRQVHGERRNDRWAWADLGQCQLLLGDIESAKRSYRRMRDLGDSETVESVLAVLRRLWSALEPSDAPVADALRQGIAFMAPDEDSSRRSE